MYKVRDWMTMMDYGKAYVVVMRRMTMYGETAETGQVNCWRMRCRESGPEMVVPAASAAVCC